MEADWYVDPLGRYEGRYFDGDQWTDQVKEEGRLAVDPDWNRPAREVAAASGEPSPATAGRRVQAASETMGHAPPARDEARDLDRGAAHADDVVDAEIVDSRPARAEAATHDDDLDQVDAQVVTPSFDDASPKAVEPVVGGAFGARMGPIGDTDYSSESPTRQVAVLGDRSASTGLGAGGFDLGGEQRSRRWMYVLGALVLAVALAVVLLPRLFGGGDELAEPAGSDDVAVQQDAPATGAESADGAVGDDEGDTEVELLPADDADAAPESDASGDATDGAVDDAAPADNADRVLAGPDSIAVGGLEVLNGKPSLIDLTSWHRSSLGAAAASLPEGATCWFGRLGDAVVQNAHCGPVVASTPEEVRFDLVPLKFEDISEGVIQVRALTDAVVTDAALPNGLILVGPDGELDPATFESAPAEEEAPVEEAPVEETPTGDESIEPTDEGEEPSDEPTDAGRGGRGSRTVEDE